MFKLSKFTISFDPSLKKKRRQMMLTISLIALSASVWGGGERRSLQIFLKKRKQCSWSPAEDLCCFLG